MQKNPYVSVDPDGMEPRREFMPIARMRGFFANKTRRPAGTHFGGGLGNMEEEPGDLILVVCGCAGGGCDGKPAETEQEQPGSPREKKG